MRLRSNELPKELYLRFKHLVFAATDFCSSQEINLAIEQSLPLQCRLILAQHASSDLVGLARLNFFVEHHRTWALPMYPADGDSWPKDEDARFESFEPAPRSHFGNGQNDNHHPTRNPLQPPHLSTAPCSAPFAALLGT